MIAKNTLVIFNKGGAAKCARLIRNYNLVDEKLLKDSFNINAVIKYAQDNKIKYNTITINQ